MNNQYLKISEFSKLTGISRKSLIFYDQNGILHPAYIDPKNNYRYYSLEQIDLVSAIVVLRECGLSLSEIRVISQQRTPNLIYNTFSNENMKLKNKIHHLLQLQEVMEKRQKNIQQALALPKIPYIEIINQKTIPIVKSPSLPNSRNKWLYFQRFLSKCKSQGMITNIPISTIITKENIFNKRYTEINNFFYHPLTPNLYPINDYIPTGKYLNIYTHSSYEDTSQAYKILYNYLAQHKLVALSSAYQEYLIDEISCLSPNNYVLKLTIQIAKK